MYIYIYIYIYTYSRKASVGSIGRLWARQRPFQWSPRLREAFVQLPAKNLQLVAPTAARGRCCETYGQEQRGLLLGKGTGTRTRVSS